jgi:uncharacterized repeat protein (TIGR01451 family)
MSATLRPTALRSANRLAVSRWLAFAALCAVWIGLAAKPVIAANPPPVQVFYVPIPEDQAFTSLAAMFPGNAACGVVGFAEVAEPITTYNSISILAEGTIIYYDHWEDGFETDISHPTQPSSQIWGDGVVGNGRPPNINSDLLAPNTVLVLRSDVTLADRQFDIDFDGGDRIAASRTIAFTRAFWARGPNTLQAGAVEVYPTDEWGTRFRAPAGVNTPSPSLFEYTALVIMAANNGTLVEVDLDANGTIDAQTTLNQGQSYLTAGTVRQGALVQASAPVQVAMVTGDICDTYEARWYVLFPENQWTNRYYSPVSTSAEFGTTAFLYNPHGSALTVTRETQGGGLLNVNIAAQSGISVPVPSTSGAAFVAADGRPFLAIAAVDTTNPENSRGDWGFALIPERQLTAQTLIGWGAGRNPDSLVNPNENSSPVWVIPVYPDGETGPVNICIDYNGDGQGNLVDVNGFEYDQLLPLAEFASARVFDPDGDQTGMLLYVCPAAANQPVTARLAAAWGEDPAIATPGQPALDLGTTAPPTAMFEAGKAATLIADADGDGEADGGDSLRYAVLIRNASRVPIPGLSISDTVPLHTTYLTSTTTVDLGSGPAPVPDVGSTAFPLDEGGIPLGTLPSNGLFTVTFDVRIVSPLPAGVDRVRNVAVVRAGDEQREPEVETPVDFDPVVTVIKAVNGDDADTPPGPQVRAGSVVTWTYLVSNTGPISVTSLGVTDSVSGVVPVFVSGDVTSTGVLDPGESWLYRATGIAILGAYSNTVTVTGMAVDGDPITATDVAHYVGVLTPAITLTKDVNDNAVRAGTTVTYTFVVSNTGDDPLRQVALTDNRCTVAFVGGDTSSDDVLDLAEAWTYTCSAVITRTVTNVAVVTAVDSLSRTITATATARVIVPVLYLPLLWAPERTVPCPPPDGCPVGAQVKALAVHTTARLVYISTRDPDQLVLMDANTTEALATVNLGGQPWGVAVNEQTNRVYVSRFTGGDVRVFNALTLAPIETIAVGDNPSLIAVLPALDTAFVLVQGGSKVAIIEGVDPTPTLVDAGGSKPFGIAADPVFGRIFISHRDSHSLSVLRREGGVWKAFAGPQFTDNRQVFEIAYDTATQRLFVVYARTIEGVDRWFLDVWEPRDVGDWGYFATRDIPSGGAIASSLVGGTGIEINPSTGNLFITNTGEDSLTVMDATTLGPLATVALGDDPFAVAINRLFNEVYVGLRTPGRLIKLVDAY